MRASDDRPRRARRGRPEGEACSQRGSATHGPLPRRGSRGRGASKWPHRSLHAARSPAVFMKLGPQLEVKGAGGYVVVTHSAPERPALRALDSPSPAQLPPAWIAALSRRGPERSRAGDEQDEIREVSATSPPHPRCRPPASRGDGRSRRGLDVENRCAARSPSRGRRSRTIDRKVASTRAPKSRAVDLIAPRLRSAAQEGAFREAWCEALAGAQRSRSCRLHPREPRHDLEIGRRLGSRA